MHFISTLGGFDGCPECCLLHPPRLVELGVCPHELNHAGGEGVLYPTRLFDLFLKLFVRRQPLADALEGLPSVLGAHEDGGAVLLVLRVALWGEESAAELARQPIVGHYLRLSVLFAVVFDDGHDRLAVELSHCLILADFPNEIDFSAQVDSFHGLVIYLVVEHAELGKWFPLQVGSRLRKHLRCLAFLERLEPLQSLHF
ncbi:MAG: hypothetical protein VXZ35_11165 [Pseudomonadota bacterium]|nr:hypothetical protein [Pseudomonadota bacterium]